MVRLGLHQFRYDLRAFLRNGQSRFFTLVLPVLFLVIFANVFGGRNTVEVAGGRMPTSVYYVHYVPGIITLGIIAAAFVNLVISVTAQRESGRLSGGGQRRCLPPPSSPGGPLPQWSLRSASPRYCWPWAGHSSGRHRLAGRPAHRVDLRAGATKT